MKNNINKMFSYILYYFMIFIYSLLYILLFTFSILIFIYEIYKNIKLEDTLIYNLLTLDM